MRKHITSFDTRKHHVHLECFLTDTHGILYSVAGILDTGAPQTEFSDQFLVYAGLLESRREKTIIPTGLQTHKYGKLTVPSVKICGHEITAFEDIVSSFEASWGIDALTSLSRFNFFACKQGIHNESSSCVLFIFSMLSSSGRRHLVVTVERPIFRGENPRLTEADHAHVSTKPYDTHLC